MKTKKTTTDGWECVPELKEVSETLEQLRNPIYEIDNCVRKSSLEDIVTELQGAFENSLIELKCIDTDIEYETVYEDY
jgi:hypothetical protein